MTTSNLNRFGLARARKAWHAAYWATYGIGVTVVSGGITENEWITLVGTAIVVFIGTYIAPENVTVPGNEPKTDTLNTDEVE